jgi:tetratricopeptide (TPR) repeat protein
MSRIFMLIVSMFVFAVPSQAGNNALLGALIGAGAGAAIGHSVNRAGGAGTGAAIGALGGYVIGSQMDKSAEQQQAPQAQQPPAAQGGTQLGGSDCQTADNNVDQAARSSNNDDKIYLLQEAVRLCPGNARAHNDLGVAYYTRKGVHDRDRARDEINEALRINPDYTVAQQNLRNM